MAYARNRIGGNWEETGGRFLETTDPATGEQIGRAPRSTAADVDRAVAAALAAFPAWSATARPAARGVPAARGRHPRGPQGGARAADDARDGQGEGGGAAATCRRPSTWPTSWRARAGGSTGTRRRRELPEQARDDAARGDRRVRADHALELPGRDPVVEVAAGAGLRQHRRHQAVRGDPGLRDGVRRVPRRGRLARRAS